MKPVNTRCIFYLILFLPFFLTSQEWELQHPEGILTLAEIEEIAISEEGYGLASNAAGLFMRTNDFGVNWIFESEEYENRFFSLVAAPNAGGQTFYAGSTGSIWKTTDGGATWTLLIADATGALAVLMIECPVADTIFAAASNALIVSTDGGENWNDITPPDVGYANHLTAVDGQNIWLGNRTGQYFSSDDGGQNWTTHTAPEGNGWVYPEFVSPTEGFMVNSTNLYHSTDAGLSWTPLQTSVFPSTLRELVVTDATHIYAVHGTTLYRSADGGQTLDGASAGPGSFDYNGLAALPGGKVWVGDAYGRVWYSEDFGEQFVDQLPADRFTLASIDFSDANNGWATGASQLLRTDNAGLNWENVPYPGGFSSANKIDVASADDVVMFANQDLLQTTDGGENWTQLLESAARLHGFQRIGEVFLALDSEFNFYKSSDGGANWQTAQLIDANNATSLFFLDTQTGFVVGRDHFFKTTDGGENWTEVTLPVEGLANSVVFIDELNGWISYGGITDELYQTADGGESWNAVSLPANFRWMEVIADSPDVFYAFAGASTSAKLYGTTDGGQNWEMLYDRIFVGLLDVERVQIDNTLRWWMAGLGGAIYFLDQSTTSTIETKPEPLTVFPNPAHGILQLDISEQMSEDARLLIYSNLGGLVFQAKASKTVDISNLEDGTYFIEIREREKRYLTKLVVQH